MPTRSAPATDGRVQVRRRHRGLAWVVLAIAAQLAAPSLTLATETWDVGPQAVGTTSPPATFSFSNAGESGTISSILAIGPFAPSFQLSTSDADCVAFDAGATCSVQVVFAPPFAGIHDPVVVVSFTDGRSPLTFQLTGLGTDGPIEGADVIANVSSVVFGATIGGTTTAAINVLITNRDPQSLRITGFSTVGDPGFVASTSDPACQALVTGARCTIQVRFAPPVHAVGTLRAMVFVNFDAATSIFFEAIGTAYIPELSLDPVSVDFGTQVVGTSGSAQPVTITNTGGGPVAISSVTASGDFSRFGCFAPTTLAVGQSCTVQVTFTPTGVGPRTGQLTISSTAGVDTVPLSGLGAPTDADAYDVAFRSPIDAGAVNVGKLGRVIPVKAEILLDGVEVRSGIVRLYVRPATGECTGIPTDAVEAYASGASNVGNDFRWDATADLWAFNLDTSAGSGFGAACYLAEVYVGASSLDPSTGQVSGGSKAGAFRISLKR